MRSTRPMHRPANAALLVATGAAAVKGPISALTKSKVLAGVLIFLLASLSLVFTASTSAKASVGGWNVQPLPDEWHNVSTNALVPATVSIQLVNAPAQGASTWSAWSYNWTISPRPADGQSYDSGYYGSTMVVMRCGGSGTPETQAFHSDQAVGGGAVSGSQTVSAYYWGLSLSGTGSSAKGWLRLFVEGAVEG